MSHASHAPQPAWRLALAGVGLVVLGAFGMYAWLGGRPVPADASPPPEVVETTRSPDGAPVAITLTPDAIARMGLRTDAVRGGVTARRLALPGVVEPNGYRTVDVTTLVAGTVTSVRAELGDRVRAGAVMAEIYSPELAQAERGVIAMRADVETMHLQVDRLERLVAIGAASRQELEAALAQRTRHETELEGARTRLQLLGVSPEVIASLTRADQIRATIQIPAPNDGIVTRRLANTGQNVDASATLFTVVDLSTVWIIGDVYERDLSRVRVGSPVAASSEAVPGETWRGRVSYIDPQIAMSTRTARLRVEVANPGERLRLGMFAELMVEEAAAGSVSLVPAAAVQVIGDVQVVYVAAPDDATRFLERSVQLGASNGSDVEVLAGLEVGEQVVTVGSFLLRAERGRLGLPSPVAPGGPGGRPEEPPKPEAANAARGS